VNAANILKEQAKTTAEETEIETEDPSEGMTNRPKKQGDLAGVNSVRVSFYAQNC